MHRRERSAGSTPEASVSAQRRFLVVALGALVGITTVLILTGLALDDGHFTYVFDDAAIHLSMARQLTEHATWGVTAHHYASASSSPAWTLLLAAFTFVLPVGHDLLPLAFNLVAAFAILVLFARHQEFLHVREGERLSACVVVLVVAVLWFLPSLVLAGMEHIVHAALFVGILVLVDRRVHVDGDRTMPLALMLALATAVRYETSFIAVGVAIAMLCASGRMLGRDTRDRLSGRTARRASVAVLMASALPIAIVALVNRAFGEGYVPNSIVAKTGSDRVLGLVRTPTGALAALTSDPALLALAFVAGAYLLWAAFDGPQRNASIAVTFLVTAWLHVSFADMGWFERYQAYLIIGGSFVALRICAEVFTPDHRRRILVAVLVVCALAMGKSVLLVETPLAMSNTYRQRYQVAKFLHRYYDGHAFLTGELGYTTLLHNGAVVDVLGLGTYPVAVERHAGVETLGARFVERLIKQSDVQVFAVYASAPGFVVPADWTVVAHWHLAEPKITIPDSDIAFFARKGASARVLERRLKSFESELPTRVTAVYREELFRQFVTGA